MEFKKINLYLAYLIWQTKFNLKLDNKLFQFIIFLNAKLYVPLSIIYFNLWRIRQVFPFGGGWGRKELEMDIYAKIYKWLGLTGSNRYKVLTYFG